MTLLQRIAPILRGPLLVLLVLLPCSALSDQGNPPPRLLRVGFLQRLFYDADPRDAKAALEVQLRQVSRVMNLDAPPSIVLYADMQSIAEAVRRGELEMVTMPSIQYLMIRHRLPLIPSFVNSTNNGQGSRFVVVVRSDRGIGSFAQLRNSSILLPPFAKYDEGRIWLETLTMSVGAAAPDRFFRQVRESRKLSHALMSVFLGQADAAVVTRSGLDASRQLNPQVNRALIVLAESRNLSDGLTCLIPSTPEKFRNDLTRAILQLNGTRSGQQMFTLFQSTGITSFKPSQLEGLELLLHEHERLGRRRTLQRN